MKSRGHSRHGLDIADFQDYSAVYLTPLRKIWMEAMLTAAVWFLVEEVGVKRIYYHTYEMGCRLKWCSPPRSIYTQLPKKLCFQETESYPPFLGKRLKRLVRRNRIRFFYLDSSMGLNAI